MKRYNNPSPERWEAICKRPSIDTNDLNEVVQKVLDAVRQQGDAALFSFSQQFDQVELSDLQVSQEEIQLAELKVSTELKKAIDVARNNIEVFHRAQSDNRTAIETTPGVKCWRENRAIDKVGLYIPGGSAPLFSTVLMLGVPARLAGCKEVILCTPPAKDGSINPVILYTANLVGISKIFKVGGAQAIAAMAYGTELIPQVYKIFGPGNQYVTKAKELVQQTGTAIDMPAGPSEVLIIADESCEPAFVAADLLSQAEHGGDSQVILLSTSNEIIDQVMIEMDAQLEALPRKVIANQALEQSRTVLLNSIEECIALSNYYAPEHLIIASDKAENYLASIQNAGSVFIGNYSCESAGDYASGTNHTLPTNGYAKNYSGVSLDSFVKKITFQRISAEGIRNIGPAIEEMAEAEQLIAHKNAVTLRLKSLKNV